MSPDLTPDADEAPLRGIVGTDGSVHCSLEEAALVLARQEYPHLDPAPYLQRIDALAALAHPMLSERPDPAEIIGVVNDVLFRDQNFRGNVESYYEAQNSFLNDVLDRRIGIPITLSILYMAVARRAGLELQGSAFPGHFLVIHARAAGWPIVVDAFHRGRILSQDDCIRLRSSNGEPEWDPRHLLPVSKSAILRRMLNNLKAIYLEAEDWQRVLRTSNQILVVSPNDADEHFTRGVALAGCERPREALLALEHYLTLRPNAENRDETLDLMTELRRRSK